MINLVFSQMLLKRIFLSCRNSFKPGSPIESGGLNKLRKPIGAKGLHSRFKQLLDFFVREFQIESRLFLSSGIEQLHHQFTQGGLAIVAIAIANPYGGFFNVHQSGQIDGGR